MKVRIKFAKYGAMKFLGHLDVMRYFQKAIRRSGIDIAYSEGFSPHQIMSFAAPLSVGCTSEGEYFDIRLNAPPDGADINAGGLQARLNAVMVEGMEILEVGLLKEPAQNAMASVEAAAYLVGIRDTAVLPKEWPDKLIDFYANNCIPVVKKTKKGEREINLKDYIYDLSIQENIRKNKYFPETGIQDIGIHMLLNASSGGNIKPAFVMDVFLDSLACQLPEFALLIHRVELYQNIGTMEKRELVPLLWEK